MYHFLSIMSILLCSLAYGHVKINGVPDEIAQNIEKRLNYRIRNIDNEADNRLIDQIEKETLEAIKPYGYFNATVNAYQLSATNHIQIDVSLNKLAHIQYIELSYTTAPNNPSLERLLKKVSREFQYAPFTNKTLKEIHNKFLSEAASIGYNDLVVTRGYTAISRYNNLAQVSYIITPNDKNLFGEITLPEGTDIACFNRYHNIKEGQYYDNDKLLALQKNMMRSGQFSESSVRTSPRKDKPFIQDILIDYKPSKSIQYFLGVGGRANLSENEVQPQFQFNITLNNLGGCGRRLSTTAKISSDGEQLQTNMVFPFKSSVDDFGLLSLMVNTDNVQKEDSSEFVRLSALIQRKMTPFTHQVSLNFLNEESKLNAGTAYTTDITFPKYRMISVWKIKKSRILAKTKFLGGISSLGSDITFAQVNFTGKANTVINRLFLTNQASFGKIYTNDFNQFPLSMQYFLGGPESNRGLKHHEINEGQIFFLSRNHAQIQLRHNFLFGVFYDTGYCKQEDDPTVYYPAAGFIGSYTSSYGNFEISAGRLIDGDNWVVLFNIAPGDEVL